MANTNFTQRFAHIIRKKLTKIYQKNQDPDITRDIIQLNEEITQILEQETNYIQFDGIIRQRFLNHLAGDIGITDQRREWFLYKAIIIIITSEEFDNLLQKTYKDQYYPLKNKINQLGTTLEELKYHYDMMLQNPRDTQKYKYHNDQVNKKLKNLPPTSIELNQLLHLIANKTNLGQYTVPQQAISRITQEYKKADIVEERKPRPEPERIEPSTGG